MLYHSCSDSLFNQFVSFLTSEWRVATQKSVSYHARFSRGTDWRGYPRDHISAGLLCPVCRRISGAAYPYEPAMDINASSLDRKALAMPKSAKIRLESGSGVL